MKTLAEILAEDVDEIIRTANAINKLIEDSKQAGVKWPELTIPEDEDANNL